MQKVGRAIVNKVKHAKQIIGLTGVRNRCQPTWLIAHVAVVHRPCSRENVFSDYITHISGSVHTTNIGQCMSTQHCVEKSLRMYSNPRLSSSRAGICQIYTVNCSSARKPGKHFPIRQKSDAIDILADANSTAAVKYSDRQEITKIQ